MNYKILSVVTFLIAALPTVIFAQTPPVFEPLVGIPGITDPSSTNVGAYINALYTLSISIAALLAVIKIIIAGVKYVLSDVVTSKAEAKSDIQGALVGLLIVISAVVVLETINPQLRVMRLFVDQVSQPPARAVPPARTETGAAPLPGVAIGQADVITRCDTEEACAQARTACTSSTNGRIVASRTNTRRVTCSYGRTEVFACEQVNSSSDPQFPGTITGDCTAASAQCPVGSEERQTGEFAITCFTPNPPNPRADDRGTRGGA